MPMHAPAACRTVHPHTRGDNMIDRRSLAQIVGSPPHAWGQLSILTISRCRDAVHPHTRGDNASRDPAISVPIRFTPTRVGTTVDCIASRWSMSVHPHTRGDNVDGSPSVNVGSRGSPPHAWGQLMHRDVVQACVSRFTPTRVGTTHESRDRPVRSAVHPHTRGDNAVSSRSSMSDWPVHPHTRGDNVMRDRIGRRATRFTPTRVGTTR